MYIYLLSRGEQTLEHCLINTFNSGEPNAYEEARYEESNYHSSDPRETHLLLPS